MVTCTFFGHRECPSDVKPLLWRVLVELIETQGIDTFYVGNQGEFDAYVKRVLRELAVVYPHIRYGVVLYSMPRKPEPDSMLPEGMELVHPRYAIDRRNRWMLEQASIVVTYVTHSWGGAAKYAALARRMGKKVIDLPLQVQKEKSADG